MHSTCNILDMSWYESANTKYLLGIDILKIYAIIMVVLTHCISQSYLEAHIAEIWIRNCVPIFLIIGAFSYSRKYFTKYKGSTPPPKNSYLRWFNKTNFVGYFKRISVPYLCFMALEVIVLPLVGYTTLDMAFLNTVKGGMGPGGYYLVVYAQLFLLIPFINALYEKSPFLAFSVCFLSQYVYDVILHYLLLPIYPSLIFDINKYIALRFATMFFAGVTLFYEFDKIRIKHIIACIVAGFMITAANRYVGGCGIYAVESLFSIIQGTCWCFGIVAIVIFIFKDFKRFKLISLLGGSTLHILLFQQLYFCCVGTENNRVLIDAPIALLGGLAIYLFSIYTIKPLCKKFKLLQK